LEKSEKIINRQEQTLAKSLDMVKFAESKNLALITFNTAIIIIASQFVTIDLTKWYMIVPLIFWGISTVILIVSFIPITNPKKEKNYDKKNLTFYSDISDYTNREYHKDVMANISNDDDYTKMINDQIMANARIALRKFNLFKLAIRFLFVLTILLYLADWYIKDKKSV